ncbi:Ceramide synthase 6 [Perkinsus olseni]|uniref:Ceramide synthase 6 n=1 Tax=Perkinsus olseni TaxID=32597 RepID=A0A7J6LQZ9_PEROL|nr:Ceramide synthase 6 [Perkinsus olseni]
MASPGIDTNSTTAVSSNEEQQEGSFSPSTASCELRIQKLEEELCNLRRRLVSQELVIQELCGIGVQWKRVQPSDEAREEVDSVPSPRVVRSAVVAIAEELAAKRKRSKYVVYASLGVAAVLSGVIARILYTQWQYSSRLEHLYDALVAEGAALPPLEELTPSSIFPASPVLSANDAATAPVWILFAAVRWMLNQVFLAAASVVDRLLRTIVWILVAVAVGYGVLRRMKPDSEEDVTESEGTAEVSPSESTTATSERSTKREELELKVSEFSRRRSVEERSSATLQRRLTDPSCSTFGNSTNYGDGLEEVAVRPADVDGRVQRRYTDPSRIQQANREAALRNVEVEQEEQDARRRRAAMRYPFGWQPAAFRLQGCPWYGQGAY